MGLSQQQLEFRRSGITATDAAAIVGLSPWKTSGDVWVEKLHPEVAGQVTPDPAQKRRMEWGFLDEPVLQKKYETVTGLKLKHIGTVRSTQIPWLIATPDWVVDDYHSPDELPQGGKIVEGKITEAWESDQWGDAGTDLVPDQYLIQCFHQMMTLGFKEVDIAARIGLYRFSIYHLFWSNELVNLLYNAEEEFYNRCIVRKERPEFDFGQKLRQYITNRYPRADDKKEIEIVPGSDGRMITALLEHRRLATILKTANEQKETQRTVISALMEDASKARWKDEGISVSYPNPKAAEKDYMDREALCERLFAMLEIPADQKEKLIREHTQKRQAKRVLRIYDPALREE